ncbi:MAG TPA: PEP-CTERM sorting domain-containing protein [Bryobacteraceae bacterium]|jgi:hypothetical protein|nr:PEP-CTERM sorting domain-containing protein [Bryobacteraceae bacterium]
MPNRKERQLQNQFSRLIPVILAAGIFSATAFSATINVGYVAFDVSNPPLAEIDIGNLTGPNSALPDFPITTALSLSNLSLTVDFSSGGPATFGPSSGYFTLSSDGLSFDGQDIFNSVTNPVTQVTLTGDFSSTTITSGGSSITIDPSFTATITDSSGILADGDAALILATTAGTTPPGVPEPGTYALFGIGLLATAGYRFARAKRTRISSEALRRTGTMLVCICLVALGASAATPVQLAAVTSPQAGVSGLTDVWVTGTGFPGGSFQTVTVSIATSCGATGTTTTAIAERPLILSTDRVEFLVPASLATGTYYVNISGSTTGGAFASGTSCSKLNVTHTSSVLASCNPGSSMGMLSYNPSGAASTPIAAYVPNGYWDGGTGGVQVVPIEGGGSPASVSTTNPINSCSSNSITGETVCIDNFAGIYLIQGTSLASTLTSGATAYAGFSGGSCENCTVAVNEAAGTKGQAVIGIGYSGAVGGTALQFLDLASNTLGTPVPMSNETSEDILWDPFRNLVLSPNESGVYDLFKVTGSGIPGPTTVSELADSIGDAFDSAAEDCTTQIALSSIEGYPTGFYIVDLSQISSTPGTPGNPGTYTAPGQTVAIPEFSEFSAATDGIAVAPGSTHLAVITGEFGGNQFGALSLPATSGSGTPALVDYVAAALPSTPDGCGFSAGYDPHTTTAYTSPNNGKAYGVMADWDLGAPSYVAVVDLAALLSAPRKTGIYPDGSACPTCVNTVDPTYDLVANGVVKYVPTGNATCASPATSARRALTRTEPRKAEPANRMPYPKRPRE